MLSEADVIEMLRRWVDRAGTQLAAAKEMGVSAAHLNDVLAGRRSPAKAVLTPLGLVKIVSYDFKTHAGDRP